MTIAEHLHEQMWELNRLERNDDGSLESAQNIRSAAIALAAVAEKLMAERLPVLAETNAES